MSKKHFGPDIITIVIDRFQMEEVESTFSKPPIYYKDFGSIRRMALEVDSPSFSPCPPPPMEGDFWSFGVVRNINVCVSVVDDGESPLPDYVNRQWEPLYDKSKYIENGPQKADDIKECAITICDQVACFTAS